MNKKIIMIIFLFVVIFNMVLLLFVLDKKVDNKEDNNYVEFNKIKMNKVKEQYDVEMKDFEFYKEHIIYEDKLSTEYTYFHNDKTIDGHIYIGTNKYLYITDDENNSTYRVSTIKFKTLYYQDFSFDDGIFIYLISEDNKIHLMALTSNDITKAVIHSNDYKMKFVYFAEFEQTTDMYGAPNSIYAVTSDNEIYNVISGMKYDESIISLYKSIYVYSDKTLSDVYGNSIEDANGNKYKIKYIFDLYEFEGFIDDIGPVIAIITEDMKFIYVDLNNKFVYEFNKKVKDLSFDEELPYLTGNLEIIFDNNYKVNLKAQSNEYYSLNKITLN